jgi:hypothetical protein
VSDDPKNEITGEPEGKPVAADVDVPATEDPTDAASPAAILKRVSALDEEDELERIARTEEAKLEARRSQNKKPKKKSGLESAASKRLSQIGAKAPKKREVAIAVDADPLLNRTTDLRKWATENQNVVSAVIGAAVLALAGSLGYVAYEHKREGDASVQLGKAMADERGRIGDPDKEEDDARLHDPTPVFRTVEDRRAAALAGYREVESKYKGTGAATLARLSEGSILLDKEDADGAIAAYDDVSKSPLAKADNEVRGRAVEGLGFAYELKADAATGDVAKGLWDKAAQSYRELENIDVMGWKELGMYHQARILQKEGSTPEAIEMLKKLHTKLHGEKEEHPFVYLEGVADEALRSLAPDALPPKQASNPMRQMGLGGGKGGGKNQIDPEMLKKYIEEMQKNGGIPGGKGGGLPVAPK